METRLMSQTDQTNQDWTETEQLHLNVNNNVFYLYILISKLKKKNRTPSLLSYTRLAVLGVSISLCVPRETAPLWEEGSPPEAQIESGWQ